jgi:hypothetical protein
MLDAVQNADPLARRRNVFETPATLMPERRATTFMPERRPTPPPFIPEHRATTFMPEPGPAPLVPEYSPTPSSRSRRTIWFAAAAALIVAALGIWLAVRSSNAKSATAQPVFTPAAGAYTEAQPVVISDTTPNAVIHYTVDGSTPTEASPTYFLPITSLPSGAVLSAMATAEGHTPSADVTGVYHWGSTTQSAANGAAPAAGGSAYDQGKSAYDQGKSAYDKKQYGQARTLFAQACNGGEKNACNYLGSLYAEGQGGALDQGKAREVYQKGCELGNLRSCASLGTLYQDDGNSGEARKYFQKACSGGVACDLLHGMQ